jgi:hypothetical protein
MSAIKLNQMGDKMKLSKLLAISLTCLTLVACDDREGTLTVQSPITLKAKKGNATIPAGTYEADIEGKSKTEIQLEIKLNKDKKIEANFKVPKNALDQRNIFISSKESGQPYDIEGLRDFDSQTTAPQWSTRSCTYTTYEYRCWTVQNPPVCHTETICQPNGSCSSHQTCHPNGSHQECGQVAVNQYGRQDYEYTTTYTTDTLDIDLKSGSTAMASFHSVVNDSHENIMHMGVCR